jgi:glycosyltransferase involved in cell wall biosynthesis
MTLPPRLAKLGRRVEFGIAPRLYRRTPIVTLSSSSKQELVQKLRLRPEQITVVPPGIDATYAPGGERSPTPLVVAVGRLVPVKRLHLLIDALAGMRPRQPALRAVLVGEGYERESLEKHVREVGADDWITFAGWVDEATLLDLYRSAWVVASASAHEGWGMTITEAAACGTPAVATRIAGHADAVAHERTGLLVEDPAQLGPAIERVLTDTELRTSLSTGALEHASRFTWEATARGTLEVLANEVLRRRRS